MGEVWSYMGNRRDPCGDGHVLYLDCGSEYTFMPVIKLHGTKYSSTKKYK